MPFIANWRKNYRLKKPFETRLRIHLSRFAREHQCKPIPPGEWVDETLTWTETGVAPTDVGNPLTNLESRFALYARSLERRNDRLAGERAAHLLASWCGCGLNAIFILYATPLFHGQWKVVKDIFLTRFTSNPEFIEFANFARYLPPLSTLNFAGNS